MALPEKTYENKIKKLLTELGAYHVKFFGCGYTQAGVPDILASVGGHFVAIEVKAKNGRPSELQLHNLRQIDASGGFAILTYPDDYDELVEILRFIRDYGEGSHAYYEFRKRYI